MCVCVCVRALTTSSSGHGEAGITGEVLQDRRAGGKCWRQEAAEAAAQSWRAAPEDQRKRDDTSNIFRSD